MLNPLKERQGERTIPRDNRSSDTVRLAQDEVELTGRKERAFSDERLRETGVETELAETDGEVESLGPDGATHSHGIELEGKREVSSGPRKLPHVFLPTFPCGPQSFVSAKAAKGTHLLDLVPVLLDQVRELEEAVGTRGGGEVGPRRLSCLGAGDGAVDIGFRGNLKVCNLHLRSGVEERERLALRRIDEGAVDEEACAVRGQQEMRARGEECWEGGVGGESLDRVE